MDSAICGDIGNEPTLTAGLDLVSASASKAPAGHIAWGVSVQSGPVMLGSAPGTSAVPRVNDGWRPDYGCGSLHQPRISDRRATGDDRDFALSVERCQPRSVRESQPRLVHDAGTEVPMHVVAR